MKINQIKKTLRGCLLAALAFMTNSQLNAQTLAFPGAEGFGAYATGGRGGTVVHVTNLNASGAGSLADAVSKPNRIVVFDVGGVIDISGGEVINISDNITIAGQTAPGGGITVYGNRVIANGKNIIIRYLRMRGSIKMNSGKCTFTCDGASNIILDHCSISWGRWDNVHITNSTDITWQNCIISEGIDPQNFGAITDGTRNWTISHCLWANNKSRNPKLKCYAQQINNVIYNCAMGSIGGHSAADNYQDLIGNYYIEGPDSRAGKYFDDWTATDHLYSKGNYTDQNRDGMLNGTLITDHNGATAMSAPALSPTVPVTTETAKEAYKAIVEHCGASHVRDIHDMRIISQLQSLGKQGQIIYDEAEVGGIGTVPGSEKPKDTDGDGMPDEWELANGLNPKSAADAMQDANGDGYTNIEEYINSLAVVDDALMYPTGVTVTGSGERARLKWTNTESRATAVLIEQSTDNKTFTQVAEVAKKTTTYTVTDLNANRIYYFRLRNTDGEHFSPYTPVVTVNKPADPQPGESWNLCDPTRVYNIFTFGTHSGSNIATATADTPRRYLYVRHSATKGDSLLFRESISEADFQARKNDAVKKLNATKWHITPSEEHPGYYIAQNIAHGTWLQIAGRLSSEPVEFYPSFQKYDLGHQAFALQVSKENTWCFNVGIKNETDSYGPLSFANGPADRTRLRWIFEDAGEFDPETVSIDEIPADPITPSSSADSSNHLSPSTSPHLYDLFGRHMTNPPTKGLYIVNRRKIMVK